MGDFYALANSGMELGGVCREKGGAVGGVGWVLILTQVGTRLSCFVLACNNPINGYGTS